MKKQEVKELYNTFVGEEAGNAINALKVRKDTKMNLTTLYGFMVYLSTKDADNTQRNKTGRYTNEYSVDGNNYFALGYKTIEKETGIAPNSISSYIATLSKLRLIYVRLGKKIKEVEKNESCDTITIPNTITNTTKLIYNISNLEYKEPYNISEEKENNIIIKENELIEKVLKEVEQLKAEVKSLQDENKALYQRIEVLEGVKAEKVEQATVEQPTTKVEYRSNTPVQVTTTHTNYKERQGKYWDSWNTFITGLTNGKIDYLNTLDIYQQYTTKVNKYFTGEYIGKTQDTITKQYIEVINRYYGLPTPTITNITKCLSKDKERYTVDGVYIKELRTLQASDTNTLYQLLDGDTIADIQTYTTKVTEVIKKRGYSQAYIDIHTNYYKTQHPNT